MSGTWPPEKVKRRLKNASNKSHKETYREETHHWKKQTYGYARNKNKGSIAWDRPGKNEEARAYSHYPGD